jgi:acyl carrier protein
MNMSLQQEIKMLLKDTLQLDEVDNWDEETEILGAIPEFDSMAIVTVLTMVEENYGIMIEDDEVSAEVFETLGSLVTFIGEKVD